MRPSLSTLLVLSSVLGCGSGGDDGVPRDDDPPVTARPSRDTYQCRIERGRTDYSPRRWTVHPPALVKTAAGATFLARFESTTTNPLMPEPAQLVVSTLDLAGNLGASTVVPLSGEQRDGAVAAAPQGDGFVLVWTDASTLRMAAFDRAGQMASSPTDVITGIDRSVDPQLAAGVDGSFGLVFTREVAPSSYEARFTVIAPDRGARLASWPLTDKPGASYASPAPAIAATATGYAMIWRDPASTTGGIHFAAADLQGVKTIAPHLISAPVEPPLVAGGVGGFEPSTNALLPVPGGFLAAWTEARRAETSAGSVVRLARLDAAGIRQGTAAALRAFKADADEVEPTLIPFGDSVAVFWGHGSHIYICGGCVPDHSIELVLIDPATVTPLSNIVSLTNGGDPRAGGLLRRRIAVEGDSFLATYQLTFHVHDTPGSAAFTCTRR